MDAMVDIHLELGTILNLLESLQDGFIIHLIFACPTHLLHVTITQPESTNHVVLQNQPQLAKGTALMDIMEPMLMTNGLPHQFIQFHHK